MNTVRIDYFAVTVKDISPEKVLTDILLIPLENFTLNDWGINKYKQHYSCSEIFSNLHFLYFPFNFFKTRTSPQ
ncbi:Cro/CI family transcriptional regulator [Streptococcus pneumoniae]|nr:Cro/CI family transcriptional regulator [Streptococcus pneumoniae]CIZ34726.1 Cro/CI family transcriptional regulator [Streptococcus pneumoniae]CJE90180.1 Cro/CI family transcriptional regulator [Streptococcus pneumoniae]CJH61924.1 Cro/CI family transcriptional regulator [Streptococcus pneumoniae]CJH91230.1 Cro/CI family transcriptional regulator [Streptococcus pneumoniae]